jgi:hypothetical protein
MNTPDSSSGIFTNIILQHNSTLSDDEAILVLDVVCAQREVCRAKQAPSS